MDIIFDVDGTLLDITHRVPLIRPTDGFKKNWEAFRKAALYDTPNLEIVAIAQAMYAAGHRIVIATGRMEKEREVTYEMLSSVGVPVDHLFMRANNDVRQDYVVKQEMLALMRAIGIDPVLTFDDRQQVVDMWRANGIRCCQVAEGKF